MCRSRKDCPPPVGKEQVRDDSIRQSGSNTSALWCSEQLCCKTFVVVVVVLSSFDRMGCTLDFFQLLFQLFGMCLLVVKDTVAVFLKHHSVRDEPDLEGRTAFMWAAGKGSDDVIKIMLDLKKDLDISMTDKYGGTGAEELHTHLTFFIT